MTTVSTIRSFVGATVDISVGGPGSSQHAADSPDRDSGGKRSKKSKSKSKKRQRVVDDPDDGGWVGMETLLRRCRVPNVHVAVAVVAVGVSWGLSALYSSPWIVLFIVVTPFVVCSAAR